MEKGKLPEKNQLAEMEMLMEMLMELLMETASGGIYLWKP